MDDLCTLHHGHVRTHHCQESRPDAILPRFYHGDVGSHHSHIRLGVHPLVKDSQDVDVDCHHHVHRLLDAQWCDAVVDIPRL